MLRQAQDPTRESSTQISFVCAVLAAFQQRVMLRYASDIARALAE
jgi:hypothetical protein